VTDRGDGGELSQIRTLPVGSSIARYLGAPYYYARAKSAF
jgi:hypothetical protein